MTNIEREYKYKVPWKGILLLIVFFGLCAIVGGIAAQSNSGFKFIFINVSAYQATIFWWVVCGVSLVSVLMAVVTAIRSLKLEQRIAVTPSSIIVPKSRWSQEEQIIEYKDIKTLSTEDVFGQHLLNIFHIGGKYTIAGSMLPSRATFDELYNLLLEKIQQVK
jgi:hypothetical protein